ncbi:putative ribonuclease H-like domain-containing protein [Tanacetum coccineum]
MAYSSTSSSSSINSEIKDKCKTRLGYNAVPPPYTRNFMPPKPDLVYPSLDEFTKKPVVEAKTSEVKPKEVRKENDTPIIEDWVSDSDEEDVPKVKIVEMFNKPSFAKINFVKPTEQIKTPRKTSVDKNRQITPSPRGNKRNRNQQMSQRLGSDFEMINKACHVCGSFDHLKNDCNNWYNNGRFAKPVWTNVQRVNKQNFSKLTRPSPKRNMVPRTVLTREMLLRPQHVGFGDQKFDYIDAKGNPQQDLKDKGVIDSGCSRHMTGNRSYLTDYEEIDGGFVAFGAGRRKRGCEDSSMKIVRFKYRRSKSKSAQDANVNSITLLMEVFYVCQPPGFEDPDFPDSVYKVEKALNGLHQAPKAWYETLSTYLLDNRFQRGKIDNALFIKRDKSDILLVKVYVNDIIFGSTRKKMCTEFEKMMHKKFQMSSMGELTFFLGLQVKQKEDGIFISQDKYVNEILSKFGFSNVKTASTPMEADKTLLKMKKEKM